MSHLKPAPIHEAPEDLRHQERTYAGFVHLTKWFVIHIGLIVVGLYFAIMEDNLAMGATFMVIAVAALVFGVARVGRARAASAPTDEEDPGTSAPLEPPVADAADALAGR